MLAVGPQDGWTARWEDHGCIDWLSSPASRCKLGGCGQRSGAVQAPHLDACEPLSSATTGNPSARADGPSTTPWRVQREVFMTSVVRLGALALGVVCSGLGMYGAFEFALKLEGNAVTYLVLAAPVIAGAAAIIPVLAEATWRERALPQEPPLVARIGSCWSRRVLLRCGAGPRREGRRAGRAQSLFAVLRLVPTQHSPRPRPSLAKARADANKARAQKQCGPDCRTKLAAEATAQADVEAARRELLSPRSKATTDSPLQAPVWLLPAALDLVAFMAIWTGLSGHRPTQAVKPGQTKRRARKCKPRAPRASDARAQARALSRRTANDNVVPFQAA